MAGAAIARQGSCSPRRVCKLEPRQRRQVRSRKPRLQRTSASRRRRSGAQAHPPQPAKRCRRQFSRRLRRCSRSPTGSRPRFHLPAAHGRTDPVAALPANSTAQPLKVLTVQLHPAELGVVTVRIALRNDTLELQIETDRRDTARLVHADREALSSQLRSAGYGVETLTVRAVDPSQRPGLARVVVARLAGRRAAVAGRRVAAGCQSLGRAGARRAGPQPPWLTPGQQR